MHSAVFAPGRRPAVNGLGNGPDGSLGLGWLSQLNARGPLPAITAGGPSRAGEGWCPQRVMVTADGEIVGGFQLLSRRSRLGTIGYISKGPVLTVDDPVVAKAVLDAIIATAEKNHLRVVIVQGPDESKIEPQKFAQRDFAPNHLMGLIAATLLIDISCPMGEVTSRFRRTTRKQINRAQKSGIRIREGTEADLGTFFNLMVETCKRQSTSPSPASEVALRNLWNAFYPQNRVRLALAEYQSVAVAGVLFLCFGDRVTAWKKGWSGSHGHAWPNQMLMFEGIQWSHARGYKLFDCAGINRTLAASLLAAEELTDEQKSGRDFFLLGYGGRPVLLPQSWIYFPSRAARLAYRVFGGRKWLKRVVQFGRGMIPQTRVSQQPRSNFNGDGAYLSEIPGPENAD